MLATPLHITNGDSAATTMAAAGIVGRILPWRDILHDGPVPRVGLDQLAQVRANFLCAHAAQSHHEILHEIRQRDLVLHQANRYTEVTLWFEHDLYDQLQLLQLLDWFSNIDRRPARLTMICIDRFPGVEPFYGLGQLDAQQMASLSGSKQEISVAQLQLGHRAWHAFCDASPLALFELGTQDLSPLPFLAAAIQRHLEEFPNAVTGLSRHESQILTMVQSGIEKPLRLFAQHQHLEAAPYLGDWGFWSLLENLANSTHPLLRCRSGRPFVRPPAVPTDTNFRNQLLQITSLGEQVLRGEIDWLTLHPPDHWKGGVHLHPSKTIWRWDAQQQRLVR